MKQPGERIDRYVIEAVLGRGGMGEVYEAHDTRLGRRVALKLIHGTGDDVKNQRMLREARTAAAFEHPNVVVVYDVGEALGAPFIAMELVRGKSLRAFVGESQVSVARKLRWLVDSARALGAAHRAGLVHRDVKPDNVMVRNDGAVKVLDFGIARKQRSAVDPSAPTAASTSGIVTLTEHGVVVGTPRYSAPEQLRSEAIDGRADQFSWGVMAYELLTGGSPWSADDALGLLSQILSGEVLPLRDKCPDAPPEVEIAVMRALSKKAAERFETMDEAADAVEPFAEAPGRRDSTLPASGSTRASLSGGSGESAVDTNEAHTVGTPAARVLRRTALVGVGILAAIGGLLVLVIVVGAFKGELKISTDSKKTQGGPVVVEALGCREAKLEGDVPKDAARAADLARAIGVGACARLATDIGVDWSAPNATKTLAVVAKLADDKTEVTLKVDDREATGSGKTPVDAITVATATMAKELDRAPMTPAEIAGWGAKDEASARRIERVWRRLVLNVAKNDEASAKELTESDPDSPWPWILQVLIGPNGTDKAKAARDKALELVGKLPPARAHGLRGIMLLYRSSADLKEALKLLREAYGEAPDDPDIAGLYAAVAVSVAPEEGFAVVDRLYARFPTRSIVPLSNAVSAPDDRDLDRNQKYLDWLHKTFPESLAWSASVQHAVFRGDFVQARSLLDFAQRFGAADSSNAEYSAAWVELAALQPKPARELAARMLSDPRISVSTMGGFVTVASYFLEGRLADGEAALWREFERQRTTGSPFDGAQLAVMAIRLDRWLGRPPPSEERLAWCEDVVAKMPEVGRGFTMLRTEVALARASAAGAKGKAKAGQVLKELETLAEKESFGEGNIRDGILAATLPLVRYVRGDKEAARRWYETKRAPISARRRVALDAGLALEGSGDRGEAAKAFALARDPADLKRDALQAVLATLRLAALERAEREDAAAAKHEELVTTLWARADPGVAEAARKLK